MDRTCETFRPTEIEEGPEAFFIVLPPDPTPTLRVVSRPDLHACTSIPYTQLPENVVLMLHAHYICNWVRTAVVGSRLRSL